MGDGKEVERSRDPHAMTPLRPHALFSSALLESHFSLSIMSRGRILLRYEIELQAMPIIHHHVLAIRIYRTTR